MICDHETKEESIYILYLYMRINKFDKYVKHE